MQNRINCIIVDDEQIAREILEEYVHKIDTIELVKSCKNATEALEMISNHTIDLILLDINMPTISGLTLAKAIDRKIKVIFTTAYREYAVDGFNIQAVDYLLKPISFERFLQAIDKFFDLPTVFSPTEKTNPDSTKSNFIFVRADRKMVRINFEEIAYIESLSDYIKIYTNNSIVITRETISNMEARLPESQFIRIHRSFIVSLNQISSFTNEFVELDKKELPISRTYKDAVLKKLSIF